MGDRCSLSINYRAKDQGVFTANDFPETDTNDDDNPVIRAMYHEEVNYGGYDNLANIADKGIEFYGQHGHGGEYCAMEFVTHENSVLYHAIGHNGERVVTIEFDLDGNPFVCDGDIDHSRKFNEAFQSLIAKFNEEGKDAISEE